ncbi:MFS transporter, partial [Mesorhizobium sp. M1A.F.Ca.ET.072.01.1.1]
TFGPQNGFWVSVAAGSVALVTVLAGQCRLATPDCAPDECEAAIVPAG